MKNAYCDWCGEEMGYEKISRSKITTYSFAHKHFGKTSTRKLFICESKPSKPIYQILICENNLACSEINLTVNEISPINHYLSAQGISHPITLTLYLIDVLYTHTVLDAIVSYARVTLSIQNSYYTRTLFNMIGMVK